MNDEILYELGVDFNSSFNFVDGDIQLIKYDDNLVQSIRNRLNTNLDELNLFYDNYGSVTIGFLGWKANEDTLNFIKSELETILQSEERLTSWDYTVEYTGNGKIKINLSLNPNLNYTIETTLEITEDGVEEVE